MKNLTPNIIHIGYHKTATNWFQKILYPNVENYTYIARRKRARNAFLAASGFKFDPETARKALTKKVPPEALKKPLIICEEELSGNLHSGGLHGYLSKEVADRIYRLLPDSRIVVVIRNQEDAIASTYKQYVKEGGNYSVDRYLYPQKYLEFTWFKQYKSPLFTFDHFEYYPLIQYYQKVFGKDRVDVYLYEEFAADNLKFAKKFVDRYNLEIDLDKIPASKLNIGWGKSILSIAKFLNYFTYQDVIDKHYIVHIPRMREASKDVLDRLNKSGWFSSNSDNLSILGEENIQYIRERYRETNRLLAEELNLPLQNYNYALPIEFGKDIERKQEVLIT